MKSLSDRALKRVAEFQGLIKKEAQDELDEDYDESFEDESEEPEDEDAFIEDRVSKGYSVSFSGSHLGNFDDYDEAEQAIRDQMERDQYYPNVWFVDDHGGIDLVDDFYKSSKKRAQMEYEVIVGNIGSVIRTMDYDEAKGTFDEYVSQSESAYGRAAGEDVTMLDSDGEIVEEYIGSLSNGAEGGMEWEASKKKAQGGDFKDFKEYATWLVYSWLDSDEGSQVYWHEKAQELEPLEGPPSELAQELEESYKNKLMNAPDLYENLLEAALEEVNWMAIANNLLGY